MRIREHKDFGHGLRPGEDRDLNCLICKAEQDADQTPVITGEEN